MDLFGNAAQQKNHFHYKWYLKDLLKPSKNAYRAFGCFISCGGTSMGARLAGFNHLGGVEISKHVASIYKKNLNPKYLFVQDIRDFKKRAIKGEIPSELYDLDVLEGSPPCTTFSTCGERQKGFGKLKKFKEGFTLQTLDDLVFEYCELATILKPKIVFFENVIGLNFSYSRKHKMKILEILEKDFCINEYVINFKNMGLPQSRTRLILIATRKDLGYQTLNLNYNEKNIPLSEILDFAPMQKGLEKAGKIKDFIDAYEYEKVCPFSRRDDVFISNDDVMPCLTCKDSGWIAEQLRRPTARERILASSFPLDYWFPSKAKMRYGTGMCVPPLAAANIFYELKKQILEKL